MPKPELDTRTLRLPPTLNRRYKVASWYGDLSPSESSEFNARIATVEACGLVAEVSILNGQLVLYAARRQSGSAEE